MTKFNVFGQMVEIEETAEEREERLNEEAYEAYIDAITSAPDTICGFNGAVLYDGGETEEDASLLPFLLEIGGVVRE